MTSGGASGGSIDNVGAGQTDTDRNSLDAYDAPKVLKKSDSEKMQDLNTGLKYIDEIMSNYQENLRERGIPDGPFMDSIIRDQRIKNEAEFLRNIRGDFSKPVHTLESSDYDAIVEEYNKSGKQMDSHNVMRSLSKTEYGFSPQMVNGEKLSVYDDPVGTHKTLILKQGDNEFDMGGDCGLCQCVNISRMAGATDMTESRMISEAIHGTQDLKDNLDVFNKDMNERGATSSRDRQELLSRLGLPTYQLHVVDDRQRTIADFREAVQTGHGVIVSVDVERLWKNGQSGGHAISLISVTEDGSKFIYSDTGAGVLGIIDASDLAVALSGRPANITTNVIR